jgi:hypothetical protein
MAGLAAGVVCALVTVLVEWIGRPSRRFYTWLAVGVTVVLATPVGVFGHGANSGFDLVLFPIVPICASSFAAYWVGATRTDSDLVECRFLKSGRSPDRRRSRPPR